jgi:hypothetical protein
MMLPIAIRFFNTARSVGRARYDTSVVLIMRISIGLGVVWVREETGTILFTRAEVE